MRWVGAVVLATMVGGCTSVRVMQREGCWVRQTERWLGQVEEEMGPCARQPPTWVEDRLTRLVQECVAQADYRWQNRALAAWNRKEPLPAQESEQAILERCMNEAATAMVTENEALRTRLGEVSTDRDQLRASVETDQAHLRSSHDRIATALGEAAKKPAPAAVATATSTSDGTATTQSDSSSQTPAAALASQPVVPVMCSSAEPSRAAPRPVRTQKQKKATPPPHCEPSAAQQPPSRPEPAGSVQVKEVVAPAQAAPAQPEPAVLPIPTGEVLPKGE